MKPHIIAFDLDGTVLPGLNHLPDENAAAIRAAADAGHYPVIATGRAFCMCSWVHERIGLKTPVCVINGANLLFPEEGGFRSEEVTLDSTAAARILREIAPFAESMSNIYAEYNDTIYYNNPPVEPYFIGRIKNGTGLPLTFEHDSFTCSRLVFQLSDGEIAEKIEKILASAGAGTAYMYVRPGKVDMVEGAAPGMHRLQIYNDKSDKWYGLQRIAEYLGVPEDRIITFGDHWNDKMMLERAAKSYAMKGSLATEYVRNQTRLTCAEFGVADIIYEFLKS